MDDYDVTPNDVIRGTRKVNGTHGIAARAGHPHAKPVDVMAELIGTLAGAGVAGQVADPTAGAGSTLVAAKMLGRPAIGVELEERWCERAAERLSEVIPMPPLLVAASFDADPLFGLEAS